MDHKCKYCCRLHVVLCCSLTRTHPCSLTHWLWSKCIVQGSDATQLMSIVLHLLCNCCTLRNLFGFLHWQFSLSSRLNNINDALQGFYTQTFTCIAGIPCNVPQRSDWRDLGRQTEPECTGFIRVLSYSQLLAFCIMCNYSASVILTWPDITASTGLSSTAVGYVISMGDNEVWCMIISFLILVTF